MWVLKMYVWMGSSEEVAVLSPSQTLAQQGAGKVFGGACCTRMSSCIPRSMQPRLTDTGGVLTLVAKEEVNFCAASF